MIYKRAQFGYYTGMNFEIFRGTAENWDSWLLEQQNEEFLQSYAWGEFQAAEGHPVLRIQGQEEGRIILHLQGFIHTLPIGLKYLYIPRIRHLEPSHAKALMHFLKAQGFVFARIEPVHDLSEDVGFTRVKTHHRQYQYTSRLDLTAPDEELMKNFHEKTRYNIRLAEKKGVTVVQEKNAAIFWPLIKETYERDGIKSHSEKYYRDFIDLSACTQLTGYNADTPLASVLLYTFGKTCVYVHGASSSANRNLMAPYLMQWRALQFAREFGCTQYDFGGVARPIQADSQDAETFFHLVWDKNDKLSGVTRFKAGFNGTIHHSADAFDVVFSPAKYNVYKLAKKFL